MRAEGSGSSRTRSAIVILYRLVVMFVFRKNVTPPNFFSIKFICIPVVSNRFSLRTGKPEGVHPSTPPADAHRRLPSAPLPPSFRSHHYRLSVHMPRCAAPSSRLAGSGVCVQTRASQPPPLRPPHPVAATNTAPLQQQ